MKSSSLHRIALLLALLSLALCLPAIASQMGIIALGPHLFIILAVVVNILWCSAFCFLSKARGYNPLWGLILLFPPMWFIYATLFPDQSADQTESGTPEKDEASLGELNPKN